MNTAVVVVDVQNDFCHPDGVFSRNGLVLASFGALIDKVNGLVGRARAAGMPVIWVRMAWNSDDEVGILAERSPFLARAGLRTGTWGAELVDGLSIEATDHQVEKTRFSGFYQTGLEKLLRDLEVTRLVVAGVRTDFCVESTVRDAFFRDFDVVVVRDAVGGYFPALHEGSLRVLATVFASLTSLDELPDFDIVTR